MDPSKWDNEACAQWVEGLGFPQYKVCVVCMCLVSPSVLCCASCIALTFGLQEAFRANMNGRRIMSLSAKGLTRMGIRYHEDQKVRAQLLLLGAV